MNPFDDLSGDNHDQIRKYLRFFRQKKDGILRDIDREFADIKSDKLEETMFTREDMLEYSDFIASAIQVRTEEAVGWGLQGCLAHRGFLILSACLSHTTYTLPPHT
mmetsp:Transcript_34630/g.76394  ORF Transcript_34630/g.76394 Transcript_34630/m.76394 type:complete len:106 (+) Transcript_34630:102-419(+)